MTISTIRKYTKEDEARVKAAVERFCERHDIYFDPECEFDSAEARIEDWIYDSSPEDKAYHRKLWTACYCRALRVPFDVRTTVFTGYIGVKVG